VIYLVTHPNRLVETARTRLKFIGKATIIAVPQSECSSPEFGSQFALTSSNEDASEHLIRYVLDSNLRDSDLFHELCHVKLNEIGFKKVETIMERKAESLPQSEPEHNEMNGAVIFIAESYANSLLFRHFKEESEPVREELDNRFLFALPLRESVRKEGYVAIALAAGHRVAKIWSGYNEDVAMRVAFEEAFRGSTVLDIYNRLYSIISSMPQIKELAGQIQNISPEDVDAIVRCALELFENEKDWRRLQQQRTL